jgi:hypothetical protein
MAGGGMMTPPRGLGGPTDAIRRLVGNVPGVEQLLATAPGGIGQGTAMPLGGAAAPQPGAAPASAQPLGGAPPKPAGSPAGPQPLGAPAPQAGAALGGLGGLSPAVIAMIEAALGGPPPSPPPPGPPVPKAVTAPPLKPVVPVQKGVPPLAVPLPPGVAPLTNAQVANPAIASSLERVLGPVQGGFMSGASPAIQSAWAQHASNLATGTQR